MAEEKKTAVVKPIAKLRLKQLRKKRKKQLR